MKKLSPEGSDLRGNQQQILDLRESKHAQSFRAWLAAGSAEKAGVLVDDFDSLLKHLSTIHPSRYGRLLRSVDQMALTGVHILKDQVEALRFVAFIDRAYEAQIHLRAVDFALTEVFSPEYLSGGYRKKYLRAVSRIGALTDAS